MNETDSTLCNEDANQEIYKSKHYAIFLHNLERNGANIAILNLLTDLIPKTASTFEVFSMNNGPIIKDFERIQGFIRFQSYSNAIVDSSLFDQLNQLKKIENENSNSSCEIVLLINTIMLAKIVLKASELKLLNIWIIHEAWPQDDYDYYIRNVFNVSDILNEELIVNAFISAHHIVFPTKSQEKIYQYLLDRRKNEARKTVKNHALIRNGIDMDFDSISVESSKKSSRLTLTDHYHINIHEKDKVLLHIGTVCPRKAQIDTVKAFIQLYRANDFDSRSLKLIMIGYRNIRNHEIFYRQEIEELIERNNLVDHIFLLPIQENVIPFYLASDIVVCPSNNEVLPLVIGEAMAFSRPVIASNITAIPEAFEHPYKMDTFNNEILVSDKCDGILIPRNVTVGFCSENTSTTVEALYRASKFLFENPQFQIRIAENSKKNIDKFSLDEMVREYEKLIDEVIKNKAIVTSD